MKSNPVKKTQRSGAFSLLEAMIALTVVGIVAAISMLTVGNTRSGSTSAKLNNQVQQLNSAVSVYKASGGTLTDIVEINEVLRRLKSEVKAELKGRTIGHQGSLVDPGLIAHFQSDMEAVSDDPRAIWDSSEERFVVRTSGFNGARWFSNDPDAALAATEQESRRSPLLYAANDGWVWDYKDFSLGGEGGPENTGLPLDGDTTAGSGLPEALQLNPPFISVEGGTYDYSEFNLVVYLSNFSNPVGTSDIIYSIGGSSWKTYTGEAIIIKPNRTLLTYAVSMDQEHWIDSNRISETYISSFAIDGESTGSFANATGGNSMVIGGEDNSFNWGTTASNNLDPSWLLFNGSEFTDISPDNRFQIGDLTYYNGTIHSGTGANTVDLSIALSFAGISDPFNFNFTLDLINSQNVAGDEVASADYVRLNNVHSDIPVSLGGVDYNLQLEFGETSENGFSTISEFFVFENSIASGVLYGTLIPVIDDEINGAIASIIN